MESLCEAIQRTLQHYLNPVHVFCRMRSLGISKKIAVWISGQYELIVYKPLTLIIY